MIAINKSSVGAALFSHGGSEPYVIRSSTVKIVEAVRPRIERAPAILPCLLATGSYSGTDHVHSICIPCLDSSLLLLRPRAKIYRRSGAYTQLTETIYHSRFLLRMTIYS